MGAAAALIKDGRGRAREVRDLLFDGAWFTVFSGEEMGSTLKSCII